jgi:fructokinase
MTRIVVAGENLIDLIVRADGTITPVPGGGPYNTARTIGRLGGNVAYLGRISRDRFGRDIRSRLVADGVSPALIVDTDDPTTLALAELDASGAASYHFYVEGTAASGLEPGDVAGAISADTQAIHAGTLGLVLEPMAQATVALVGAAPPGVLVMVDPNVRPSIIRDADRYRRHLDAALARADVVKISSEDATWLAPSTEPRGYAADLVARGARVVLLTDGGQGVAVMTRDGATEVPVPRVAVVDTVGAGDAFGGGFLTSWLDRGLGRAELGDRDAVLACVERAIRVAAITCTRAGAEPPTSAELGEA